MAKETYKFVSTEIFNHTTIDGTHTLKIILENADVALETLHYTAGDTKVKVSLRCLQTDDIINLIAELQKAVFHIKKL